MNLQRWDYRVIPVRHVLRAVLLEAGRLVDAEPVYGKDLR